jgi:hypothetical protein
VAFTANPGAGNAVATFNGGKSQNLATTSNTNPLGIATAATLTANKFAGGFTVSASVGSISTTFVLTNNNDTAATLTAVGGGNQSATVNTAFANQLEILATDSFGNAVPGLTVTFTAPNVAGSPGANFAGNATTTAVTNVHGLAIAATLTANATAGGFTVAATATVGAVNLSASFALTNNPGPVAKLNIVAGNNQSTGVGTTFGTPLEVQALDAANNPVPGVSVVFTAPAVATNAGATFTTSTVVSNSQGLATAPPLTANGRSGTFNATATVNGTAVTATFTLTNTPATITAIAGSGQDTPISAAFSTQLQARVTDAQGNGIANVPVTFSAGIGATGSSGTFSDSPTVLTNAQGVAAAPQLTANLAIGSFTVTATAAGLPAVQYTLTNTAIPYAVNIFYPTSGILITSASPLLPYRLQARVTDFWERPVQGTTVTFDVRTQVPNGFIGTPPVTPVTAVTDANGVATANLPRTATNNTGTDTISLLVDAYAATDPIPAVFNLTLRNTPLTPNAVFASTTTAAVAATPQGFTQPPIQALVTDATGTPTPNARVTFTVVPRAGAGGTFAGGATTATVTADATGIATAPTLSANRNAGTFFVSVTAAGAQTATIALTNLKPKAPPREVTITNPANAALLIAQSAGNHLANPAGTRAAANHTFPSLKALLVDARHHAVGGVPVVFTVVPGANGAGATFATGMTARVFTNSKGQAVAPTLKANNIKGTFTVTASIAGTDMVATFKLTIV